MKQQRKLDCGGRQLKTDKLEDASEWILDNIAGLRTFELQIEIHSDDLGCSPKQKKSPRHKITVTSHAADILDERGVRPYIEWAEHEEELWTKRAKAWENHWNFHYEGCECEFMARGGQMQKCFTCGAPVWGEGDCCMSITNFWAHLGT